MYRKRLPREYEKKVLVRHRQVLNDINSHRKSYKVKVLGKNFIVLPTVFTPTYPDSIFFAKFLSRIRNASKVLDVGTGSGIHAISIASNASRVLAVDINRKAVKNTKINAQKFGIKNIEARYSNIFSNIKEKFDTIIFNPPFRYFKPQSISEKALTDENYKNLTSFFNNARKHLNENGKIYLIFSDSGDLNYLHYLIRKNKFKYKISEKMRKHGFNFFIYEIK